MLKIYKKAYLYKNENKRNKISDIWTAFFRLVFFLFSDLLRAVLYQESFKKYVTHGMEVGGYLPFCDKPLRNFQRAGEGECQDHFVT